MSYSYHSSGSFIVGDRRHTQPIVKSLLYKPEQSTSVQKSSSKKDVDTYSFDTTRTSESTVSLLKRKLRQSKKTKY